MYLFWPPFLLSSPKRNFSPPCLQKNSATHVQPKCSNTKIIHGWESCSCWPSDKEMEIGLYHSGKDQKDCVTWISKEKKIFFNLVEFGAIFWQERIEPNFYMTSKIGLIISWKGDCSRLFTVSFHSRHMEDCVWKTTCFWKGHVASSEQWYHLQVKDKQNG